MERYMIETERLILRIPIIEDFEPSYAMVSDLAVMRFIGVGVMSREDAWNRVLRYIGHWTAFGHGLFTVLDKESGAYLGQTGFADFHRGLGEGFDGFPEAAWMFVGSSHGKGYATEAASAAHEWFDRSFKPERTVCIINEGNEGSIRVAEKLGYRQVDKALYRDAPVFKLERNRTATAK